MSVQRLVDVLHSRGHQKEDAVKRVDLMMNFTLVG